MKFANILHISLSKVKMSCQNLHGHALVYQHRQEELTALKKVKPMRAILEIFEYEPRGI